MRKQNSWLKYLVVRSGVLEASNLTKREKFILNSLAEGKTMNEIGLELGITGTRVNQVADKAVALLSNMLSELIGKPIINPRKKQ